MFGWRVDVIRAVKAGRTNNKKKNVPRRETEKPVEPGWRQMRKEDKGERTNNGKETDTLSV